MKLLIKVNSPSSQKSWSIYVILTLIQVTGLNITLRPLIFALSHTEQQSIIGLISIFQEFEIFDQLLTIVMLLPFVYICTPILLSCRFYIDYIILSERSYWICFKAFIAKHGKDKDFYYDYSNPLYGWYGFLFIFHVFRTWSTLLLMGCFLELDYIGLPGFNGCSFALRLFF